MPQSIGKNLSEEGKKIIFRSFFIKGRGGEKDPLSQHNRKKKRRKGLPSIKEGYRFLPAKDRRRKKGFSPS